MLLEHKVPALMSQLSSSITPAVSMDTTTSTKDPRQEIAKKNGLHKPNGQVNEVH